MAFEDLRPSQILSRDAFIDAIVVNAAIGGSSNAQPHIVAMARHAGVDISTDDWMEYRIQLTVTRFMYRLSAAAFGTALCLGGMSQ